MRYRGQLFGSSRPSFSLVDLFALGAIQVASVGYMWSICGKGDQSEKLAFALGAGCVATFWWFVIASRLSLSVLSSITRGVYLCFFVTAAFVCPFVVAISVVELVLPFSERPGLEYEADVARAAIASALYVACFPLNRALAIKFAASRERDLGRHAAEPSETG